MGYWAVARLQPRHEHFGLIHLGLNGYTTYYPRVRERHTRRGRRIEIRPPLFWGYCFFVVQDGVWYTARWSIGVIGVIMDGIRPARVPDSVIEEIKSRERDGLIDLPKPPPLRRGARIRILHGPFSGHLAIFADMKPRQRVEILLQLLGGEQRVELPKADIEVVR
jgi:transcriptional antiterminator RfaH